MSRCVKVAALGVVAPPAPAEAGCRQLTAGMKRFWREKLEHVVPDRPDLIVLPELSNCYANHEPAQSCEHARQEGEQLLQFFADTAREHNCNLVYPALWAHADGSFRNRTHVLGRSGEIAGIYDKNHATIGETQEYGILSGRSADMIECDFGRVACVTCFDLNFEELRTEYAAARPDLLVFPSLFHGGLMQQYWAYTCRAHFVSAIGYPGLRSEMLSPLGQTLASTTIYHDFVTATLNLDCRLAHLNYNREKFKALKARYGQRVTLTDPDLMGVICIASETEEVRVTEMIREFEIELLDDYLARERTFQNSPGNCAGAALT